MRWRSADRHLAGAVVGVAAVVALYFALPAIAGLDETWRLLKSGNAWWLGLGVVLEVGSYAGYVLLFEPCSGGWTASTFAAAWRSRSPAWRRRGCSPPPEPEASR